MNGRERWLAFVEVRPLDRPLFLPLVGTYAAVLAQQPASQTLADPTRLFLALRDAQRLLGYDAHLLLPEPTYLAEAAGASVAWEGDVPRVAGHPWSAGLPGRLPDGLAGRNRAGVILEVLRRVRVAEPFLAIGVAVPGPLGLAIDLCGPTLLDEVATGSAHAEDALDLAGQAVLALIRACGEVGIDLVVTLDDRFPAVAAADPHLARAAWAPLANLASFYDAKLVLVAKSADDVAADAVRLLSPWAIITEHWTPFSDPARGVRVGVGITGAALLNASIPAAVLVAPVHGDRRHRFLTTCEPVPPNVPPGRLLSVGQAVMEVEQEASG
jgi:uroporphyrinogen decarboxylase-like protein